MDQLSGLDGVSWRAMMGEYIIYYKGKIIGGVCDDGFGKEPTKSAALMMPAAPKELPYKGAKEMLLVNDIENRSFGEALLVAMYEKLPEPKRRR